MHRICCATTPSSHGWKLVIRYSHGRMEKKASPPSDGGPRRYSALGMIKVTPARKRSRDSTSSGNNTPRISMGKKSTSASRRTAASEDSPLLQDGSTERAAGAVTSQARARGKGKGAAASAATAGGRGGKARRHRADNGDRDAAPATPATPATPAAQAAATQNEAVLTLPLSLNSFLLPFQRQGVEFAVKQGGRCLIGDDVRESAAQPARPYMPCVY